MIRNLREILSKAGSMTGAFFVRRKVPRTPLRANFRMEDAWDLSLRELDQAGDEQLSTFGRAVRKMQREKLEAIRRDLFAIEKGSAASLEPVRYLRAAIMDSAAMSLYCSHVLLLGDETRSELVGRFGESFSDREMMMLLVGQELRYTVLRTYSQFKYDDASDKDWFDCYLKVARKLMVARAPAAARPGDEDVVSGMYLGEYVRLLEKVKQHLLAAPSRSQVDETELLERLAANAGLQS